MARSLLVLLSITLFIPIISQAQQVEAYDYWQHQREMVRRGQHAIFMCNGLFTSNRNLEQLYEWELEFFDDPIGDANGGDYRVDRVKKAVEIGAPGEVPVMRAAFREGIGCVIMPPDQDLDEIERLPELTLPYPPGNPSDIPWPDGDLISDNTLPANVDSDALGAASNWAFERPSDEQQTVSLLVVYKGQIIHERYADGFDMSTRTRTWSTAKSIASTLIGMLVDSGRLDLDEPLGFDWLPESRSPETDPRNEITLRHVLNMSSGLENVDNRGLEYAIGSGLSYWAGSSSVVGARSRALIRTPGTYWD